MFPCTKLSMRAPHVRQGGVEFGRKVFLVDCLSVKNIKNGENKHNRTRSSFLHIHANLGMIQRAQTQRVCKKSGFKSYRPLVGPIATHGSCTAAVTKSQGVHAC